jgi:hypothetical protein
MMKMSSLVHGGTLRRLILTIASIVFGAFSAGAQQSTIHSYTPHVKQPAYSANGPLIAIDEAHRNFHTLSGSYAPFGRLAAADGYRVHANGRRFTGDSLNGVGILVIANAQAPSVGQSAFAPDEIAALDKWVADGGSLFLIADHAPFGTAAAALAESFGVYMDKGFVVVNDHGAITSQIRYQGASLGSHPIVAGRNSGEQVRRVTAFTGQSLSVPAAAVSILIIPDKALEVDSPEAVTALRRGESVTGKRVGGRSQLLALRFGRGRLVIAGEAAMFTSQEIRSQDGAVEATGLGVTDDQQLTLNVLHWLSGLLN